MEASDRPRSTRWAARVVRWVVPVVGCLALGVGGLWAVDLSQRGGTREAFNGNSATMYLAMIVLYGTVAWGVAAWRHPGEGPAAHTWRAAIEALVVGLLAAPLVVGVALTYSCYALDGCS